MTRWYTVVCALGLIAGCDNADSPLPLVGTLERDRIEVSAEAREILIGIHVREGDQVEAGQLLASQDPERLQARVGQARAAEARAAQRLAELQRGPRAEEIDSARARLEGAEATLLADEKTLRRTRELFEQELLSESDLDQVRARRDQSLANRDDTAALLRERLTGTTIEELEQARASLEEAGAALADQTLALERLGLRAPVAGLVDTIPYKQGDRPPAGATVMVLLTGKGAYARVYVPEPLRARVRVGMDAQIRADGLPRQFAGRVRTVSSEAAFTPYFSLTERDRSRLAYVAEIDLLGEDAAGLPAGLPVEVSFPDLETAP